MNDQPTALRLADALEQQFPLGTAQNFLDGEAAAELRRLHAENKELLEALKFVAEHDLSSADMRTCGLIAHGFIHSCRTAIKAAEENT